MPNFRTIACNIYRDICLKLNCYQDFSAFVSDFSESFHFRVFNTCLWSIVFYIICFRLYLYIIKFHWTWCVWKRGILSCFTVLILNLFCEPVFFFSNYFSENLSLLMLFLYLRQVQKKSFCLINFAIIQILIQKSTQAMYKIDWITKAKEYNVHYLLQHTEKYNSV